MPASKVTDRDLGFKKTMRKIRRLEKRKVRIGWSKPAIATRAAINELGAPVANIPARPFIRPAIDAGSSTMERALQTGVDMIFEGKSVHFAAEKMGEAIKAEIQANIDKGVPPPNKQSTVDKKGFDHPLVDSGDMRDTIEVKVE